MLLAAQYLQSAGRPTSLVDLGDIVKGGSLGIHYAWTKDISSRVTTEAQIQSMIFNYGIHIETKLVNGEMKPKSEDTSQATKVRLLEEQLAGLTATREAEMGGRRKRTRKARTRASKIRRKRSRHTNVLRMPHERTHPTRLS